MNKLNKSIFIGMALLSLFLLASCGEKKALTKVSEDSANSAEKQINIVCTIFPEYDWTREIAKGTNANITLLMKNGVDLHSYSPSATDIVKISSSDLFIYVGGESDVWIEDLLKSPTCKGLKTINLLEVLGDKVKVEEVVEGMQGHDHEHEGHDHEHEGHDHEHEGHVHEHEGHDHEHEGHDHEHEEPEYDEHVWLSLKNTKILTEAIANTMKEIDENNAAVYEKNTKDYIAALSALDSEYETTLKNAKNRTVVFCDRFPFRYLVNDYNISYYAAFVGCSAETEASFETIAFLAKKIDELSLAHTFTIENSDNKIANTVINTTKNKNADILMLDSLQSTTDSEIKDGKTYIGTMKQNLETLKKALL
ncbi:MAG: metal ABC transporter substrate-binding protein [Treponema sp.]|nr:metal ABC transporter substrate-binding protein [Treponema sp.]